MVQELVGVIVFIAALMSGWFLLQALTRRTCRGGRETDIFERLLEGCGGCESDGVCKRKSRH